jgi:hypothetical protein
MLDPTPSGTATRARRRQDGQRAERRADRQSCEPRSFRRLALDQFRRCQGLGEECGELAGGRQVWRWPNKSAHGAAADAFH